MGDRKLNSVHIQLMKLYLRPKDVKRVTSVLEGDTERDDISNILSEAKIAEQMLQQPQQLQLEQVLGKYGDVLTSEPGLTSITKFGIDTSDSEPIHQGGV